MSRQFMCIILLLIVILTFSGCMQTIDQMYCMPKRESEFGQLQVAINDAMRGMSYCAPLSGKNTQALQQADLDGDGNNEYILFAKSDSDFSLQLLILKKEAGAVYFTESVVCVGEFFDTVLYAQIDDNPGYEIVVGNGLSDQLQEIVQVHSFDQSLKSHSLLKIPCTEFFAVDFDKDHVDELFVLKSCVNEADCGIYELYKVQNEKLVLCDEMSMSAAANQMEEITIGAIDGGIPAVFVSSLLDEVTVVTDVCIYNDDQLINAVLIGDADIGIKTARNDHIYATDIDGDSIVELPYVMPMMPMDNSEVEAGQCLIRWNSISSNGETIVKSYTFHNTTGGWYVDLNYEWISQLTVVNCDSELEFYIWDETFENATKVMSVCMLLEDEKNVFDSQSNQVEVYSDHLITYIVELESEAIFLGITPEHIINSFHIMNRT